MPVESSFTEQLAISPQASRALTWGESRPGGRGTILLPAFWLLLIVSLLIRLAAISNVPLIPEEAYYWMYAKNPQLSYFDHPPMVAWVIGLGTLLFGDTEFGVRIIGNLLMVGASLLLYQCGKIWFNRNAGIAAGLMLHLLPIYFGVGMLAPMDACLFFFWTLCFLGVSLAIQERRTWAWYLVGFAMGLAMLSKYTGVFLAPCALMALLGRRDWRRQLLTPHPYLALLLAMAIFSPVIVWNAQHEWASFRFQFVDRYARDRINLTTPLILLATQLAVLTPLLLVPIMWSVLRIVRRPRSLLRDRNWVAISFAVPALLIAGYTSLRSEIHINWTSPFYVSLFPALAMVCQVYARRLGRMWRGQRGLIAGASLLVAGNILMLAYLLVLQPRVQWLHAFGPWHDLAVIVEDQEEQLERSTQSEPLVIGDGKYRLASVIAFYRLPLEPQEEATPEAIAYTTSQWIVGGDGLGYRYWSDRSHWIGSNVIYISQEGSSREELESWFESVRWIDNPRLKTGAGYHVAVCRGLLNQPRTLDRITEVVD